MYYLVMRWRSLFRAETEQKFVRSTYICCNSTKWLLRRMHKTIAFIYFNYFHITAATILFPLLNYEQYCKKHISLPVHLNDKSCIKWDKLDSINLRWRSSIYTNYIVRCILIRRQLNMLLCVRYYGSDR